MQRQQPAAQILESDLYLTFSSKNSSLCRNRCLARTGLSMLRFADESWAPCRIVGKCFRSKEIPGVTKPAADKTGIFSRRGALTTRVSRPQGDGMSRFVGQDSTRSYTKRSTNHVSKYRIICCRSPNQLGRPEQILVVSSAVPLPMKSQKHLNESRHGVLITRATQLIAPSRRPVLRRQMNESKCRTSSMEAAPVCQGAISVDRDQASPSFWHVVSSAQESVLVDGDTGDANRESVVDSLLESVVNF